MTYYYLFPIFEIIGCCGVSLYPKLGGGIRRACLQLVVGKNKSFLFYFYEVKNHTSFSSSLLKGLPSIYIYYLFSVPMTQLWNYSSKTCIVLVVFFELFLFFCNLFLGIVHLLNRLIWCVITCLVQIYFSFLKMRMFDIAAFRGERERKWSFKYM